MPPIYDLIQKKAKVAEEEMYRVFNMGVGMVVVASPQNGEELLSKLPGAWRLGKMVQGDKRVILG
ncbi:MAG: Phosphoribosylformylglycinamidine cyclo-ligase, chloroplastic/mitochondrial [Dehalococcoidia bacterium]|nr:Phosphoribosylformylglycinamidine cyclo-ligase, chloroplastic/mitochondrial [Dehalococcoidia bacterium]